MGQGRTDLGPGLNLGGVVEGSHLHEREGGGRVSERLGDGAVRKGPNAAGRGRTLTKVVLSMDEGVDHKAVEQLPQK